MKMHYASKWLCCVGRCLALASVLLVLTPIDLRADVTYTYNGNPFSNFVGLACPPDCNIQVSLTLPQPLPPNLNCTASNIGACFIIPKSFSITDGLFVITQAGPFQGGAAFPECFFLTDARGTITGWAVVANGLNWVIGTTNAPQLGFTTTDTIDSVGTGPTYFAFNTNSPGTWTMTGQGAARLSLLSGNSQIGAALTVLPNSLVVQTTDPGGSPIAGVPISFAITQRPTGATGATLALTSATTGPNGTASTQLTLGNLAGHYQVSATCAGGQTCTPASVVFNETANSLILDLSIPNSIAPSRTDYTCASSAPGFAGCVAGTQNTVPITATLSGSAVVNGFNVAFVGQPADLQQGGHDHLDTTQAPTGGTNSCTTGTKAAGQCDLLYTAPEVSGQYSIAVTLTDPNGSPTHAIVTCNGANSSPAGSCSLILMTNAIAPSELVEKPGTFFLTGQPGRQAIPSKHNHNHFGTVTLENTVATVATDFANWTQANSPAGRQELGINDMSLVWGGLFDIYNNWKQPHNLHRNGNSVDVDDAVTLSSPQYDPGPVTLRGGELLELKQLFCLRGMFQIREGNSIHFEQIPALCSLQ